MCRNNERQRAASSSTGRLIAGVLSGFIAAGASSPALAQAPGDARSDATALARGWTAIAAGKTDEAVALADQILKGRPSSHAALLLKLEGLAAGGRALAALDAYEHWLTAAGRNIEDPGLLEPVALGILRGLVGDKDLRVQFTARAALARAGDSAVRALLAKQSGAGNAMATMALATSGDEAGVADLQRFIEAADRRDKTAAIELLAHRGGVTPQIVAALVKDPVPLNRAAAARVIAASQHPEASQRLQTLLTDPDPYVQINARLGLARLGDPDAVSRAQAMLSMNNPDLQLLAAEALSARAPQAALQAVRPLLQNPDGLTRFQAAAFVGRSDPAAVRDVLLAGLTDENPLVREEAARVLTDVLPSDIATLRKLLRHESHFVVAQAAGALATR